MVEMNSKQGETVVPNFKKIKNPTNGATFVVGKQSALEKARLKRLAE